VTALSMPDKPEHWFRPDGKAWSHKRPRQWPSPAAPNRFFGVCVPCCRLQLSCLAEASPHRKAKSDNRWSDQTPGSSVRDNAQMPLTSQFCDHRIGLRTANSRASKYIGAVLDKKMGRFARLKRYGVAVGLLRLTERLAIASGRSCADFCPQHGGRGPALILLRG